VVLVFGGLIVLSSMRPKWAESLTAYSAPPKTSDELPSTTELGAREDWELLYDRAGLAQIREEIETLRRYMLEESRDYYEAEFQAGHYQVVTDRRRDGTVPLEIDDGTLSQWRSVPGLGVTRVILPREGCEHVYEAKARLAWLMSREEEVEAFEALLAKEE
jgi:hypothetical protein